MTEANQTISGLEQTIEGQKAECARLSAEVSTHESRAADLDHDI